jgi:hypothetical protein
MELTHEVKEFFVNTANSLKGADRRRFVAGVVRMLGRGGQRRAENELGWDRGTIRKGEHELATGVEFPDRRAGCKRKCIDDRLPNLRQDIRKVVECWCQTDPRFRSTERYTRLSVSEVVNRLIDDMGYEDLELPSNETIRKVMHALGFRLRKVQKTKPKKTEQTDGIFERLHEVNAHADSSPNELRICMDAKAVVKIGPFSRGGKSWVEVQACDHDFQPDAVLTPIDILLPEYDELHLYFVRGTATADTYVDVLEHFWEANRSRFDAVDTLVINQDNGPEVHSRRTQYMARLVGFADTSKLKVRLAYYPPYHSKYNPAERPWAVLENAWRGDILDTVQAAVGHGCSMRWNGRNPTVRKWLDKVYAKGKRLCKRAMALLEKRLKRVERLEKWFVDIEPLAGTA